jgi:hypothetical protein
MPPFEAPGSRTLRFEALWIFKEEIERAGVIAEVEAHTSQPIGKPLHKHEGHIEVDDTSVRLIEGEYKSSVEKSEISGLQVSYDQSFQRLRDSRGALPPMHFSFGGDQVYLFTRKSRLDGWQGQNEDLFKAIAGT